MAKPDILIVDGHAFSWQRLCELRRQQLEVWRTAQAISLRLTHKECSFSLVHLHGYMLHPGLIRFSIKKTDGCRIACEGFRGECIDDVNYLFHSVISLPVRLAVMLRSLPGGVQ